MSQQNAAASMTDISDISDDPLMHHQLCHYYQYQQVHSKGLRSEEQVKQRIRKDLIRKAGVRRTQTDVIVKVEAQVTKVLSGTGVVSLYLKKKAGTYASYKPLLKSFCHCTTDEVNNVEQQSKGEEEPTKASHEHDHSIKEVAHDVLKKDDELGHHETLPACAVLLEPEPATVPATRQITRRQTFTMSQLQSLKETGLELSEDEEDQLEEEGSVAPAAPIVNALTIEDYVNVETLSNDKKPNEENHDSSSSDKDLELLSYATAAALGLNISGSNKSVEENYDSSSSSSSDEDEDVDVEN